MADHVRFAVSCDVVDEYTTTNTASGDITGDISNVSPGYSRIHPSVGKSLGGSGSIDVDASFTLPTNGDIIATTSGVSAGTLTDASCVFIKHSGFEEALRETATNDPCKVIMGGENVAILTKGMAVVLPFAVNETPAITLDTAANDVCMEVVVTTGA